MTTTIKLTKHDNETFENQTIYLTGRAFINCTFIQCTIVNTGIPYRIDGCRFDGCNWRVECTVLWGDPLSRRALRDFIELITAEPQPESAAA